MPTYDYKCECGHVFRKLRPMSESSEPADCPKCGKSAKKTLTAPNLAPSISNWSPHWSPNWDNE